MKQLQPNELNHELSNLIAGICDCKFTYAQREGLPVTAHEYALIIGAVSEFLYARREEAIAHEHRALLDDGQEILFG